MCMCLCVCLSVCPSAYSVCAFVHTHIHVCVIYCVTTQHTVMVQGHHIVKQTTEGREVMKDQYAQTFQQHNRPHHKI